MGPLKFNAGRGCTEIWIDAPGSIRDQQSSNTKHIEDANRDTAENHIHIMLIWNEISLDIKAIKDYMDGT